MISMLKMIDGLRYNQRLEIDFARNYEMSNEDNSWNIEFYE